MKPNLFILGAARCGTSSLHATLGQHPDIHANIFKEPTFFVGAYPMVRDPITYFRLFDSPKRYRLDSSVTYLPAPETPPVLHDLFPEARFIVSLREPKARAYALYRHMRYIKFEAIPSFADALKAETDRYISYDFYGTCLWHISTYLYCRSTLYDEQLARYFALFDRKQFHIITLAELVKEPVATIEGVLRFLDLDPTPAQHFDFSIKGRWETGYAPYDAESDQIMSSQFEGLTQRTEQLAGQSLDWSV
jgi:hypothetical protein